MAKNQKKRSCPKRSCKNCGEIFMVRRKWAEFCGPECRVAYWQKQNPRISAEELEKLRHAAETH